MMSDAEHLQYGSCHAMIYRCFEFLENRDINKFVKKFKAEPLESPQFMHTFRELIVGAFLRKRELNVFYDHLIEGKTPDWCLLGDGGEPQCIIEVATHRTEQLREAEVTAALETRGAWGGWGIGQSEELRLYQRIQTKVTKYADLVAKLDVPFVVASFRDFLAFSLHDNIVENVLTDGESGLFKLYPYLSGLLEFDEQRGYQFMYWRSLAAARTIHLPVGLFEDWPI